jgi:hypothetical protein
MGSICTCVVGCFFFVMLAWFCLVVLDFCHRQNYSLSRFVVIATVDNRIQFI